VGKIGSWTRTLFNGVGSDLCTRVRIESFFALLFCVGFCFLGCGSLGSPVRWNNSGIKLAQSDYIQTRIGSCVACWGRICSWANFSRRSSWISNAP
jgi:hypothetical protein